MKHGERRQHPHGDEHPYSKKGQIVKDLDVRGGASTKTTATNMSTSNTDDPKRFRGFGGSPVRRRTTSAAGG